MSCLCLRMNHNTAYATFIKGVSLFVPWRHYWESTPPLLLNHKWQMEVSAQLRASAAIFPGISPNTHRIGGSVGSRSGLDVLENKEDVTPTRKWNPYGNCIEIILYVSHILYMYVCTYMYVCAVCMYVRKF